MTFGDVFLLLLRDDHIAEVEAQAALEGHLVTEVLDVVEELRGTGHTAGLDHATDDVADDVAERFLGDERVDEAHFLGNVLVDEHAADGGVLA